MDMDGRPLLLQISIPFCVRQCAYCAYPYCTYDPGTLRAYAKALLAEIDSCAGEYADRVITAISIEGGSPALLGADALFQVIAKVRKTFVCDPGLQISLQTMPGDYSRALMEKMRDAGVDHWIIGLETTQAAEHEKLKRPYKFDAVTMVDMAVKTFHPRALSFDLLAGIPGQTVKSLERSLDHCLFYKPDHMTIYPLRLPAGCGMAAAAGPDAKDLTEHAATPVAKDLTEHAATPVAKELADHTAVPVAKELADHAAAYLQDHGFTRYTRYDFSRDGHVHRYRLEYLQGCEHLGLGYHAESFVDGIMWKNGHSLQEYLEHAAEFDVIAVSPARPDTQSLERIRAQRRSLLV